MVTINVATKKFTELDCSVCKEIVVNEKTLTNIMNYPSKANLIS